MLLMPHITHDDLSLTMFGIVREAKSGSALRQLAESTVRPWLIPQSSGGHIKGIFCRQISPHLLGDMMFAMMFVSLWLLGDFVDAVNEKHAKDTQRAAANVPEHSPEQQCPEDNLTRRLSAH